jgi:ribosomal protein S27AE
MDMTDHPPCEATAVSAAGRTQAEAEPVPAEPPRPPVPWPVPPAPPVDRDVVGDPVCWLHEVCPGCGLFIGDDPPPTCPRCGETLPA